jgi:brefeldin A-resistance guanine nucleotide exchange factor 1
LKESTRLDKKLLGEYISAPDNLDLLKAFIGLFDFQGKSIADAMRDLLEAFRLPGEAQPIARITEAFAEHFFSFKPTEIADQDATYVLAYSVIMLNTDQHNPQNRKRMTIEDYQKNLRGVNSGKDFAPDYLATIHDSIRQREIIMPQEHVGQAGFDYAWKGLMRRSRSAGLLLSVRTSAFDKAMFEIAWRSTVTAIASAFTTSSQDEYVIQKAITGFKHCAALAGRFHLPEVIDSIVLSLAYATGLLDETDDGYQSANHPLVKTDGSSITVSPLSVRFGTSFRSQLATVVLFTIANGNGNAIREGWIQVSCTVARFIVLSALIFCRYLDIRNVPDPLPAFSSTLAIDARGRLPVGRVYYTTQIDEHASWSGRTQDRGRSFIDAFVISAQSIHNKRRGFDCARRRRHRKHPFRD